ncbi:MlaD family protein [Parvularcula sp. LCG005]|uniref:MlaD family protein n=1 Tax=Parvularcula sp. LCG005 TaxID=3078805 RepID=UPI002943381C|nr:MlaD family protein [Parvularcula sp. LCG005]WOI54128.1 MlaD family protein [Parvularcula sp. LCG005]
METRAHYVLIGAFMLGGILLAVLFTLWLGSVERDYDEYEIVFRQKISGLQEGANVLFNGIRVGEVTDLRIDRNDPNRSIAIVQVEEGTPVKTDTKVELELVGVTGLAVVQFNGGSSQQPLLKSVSSTDRPVMEADVSGIAAVIESSGDIALNVSRLLSQENAEAVTRILADIESVTDVISDKETEISVLIDNLSVASGSIRQSAERLDATISSFQSTAATVDTMVKEDAQALLDQLGGTADEIHAMVTEVNDIIADNRPAIDAFAQEGLGAAMGVITRANRLVNTTEAILLEFDRDPTRFLIGEGRPTSN